jgi:hypothetical protein
MSFRSKGRYDLVACDMCGITGAVGDTRFRLMRQDSHSLPQHLCPDCRVWAEWCPTHQQFHRPSDLHRCACRSCGGLYTSRVELRIEHCPSCLRELQTALPVSAAAAPSTKPSKRSIAGLFEQLGLTLPRRR